MLSRARYGPYILARMVLAVPICHVPCRIQVTSYYAVKLIDINDLYLFLPPYVMSSEVCTIWALLRTYLEPFENAFFTNAGNKWIQVGSNLRHEQGRRSRTSPLLVWYQETAEGQSGVRERGATCSPLRILHGSAWAGSLATLRRQVPPSMFQGASRVSIAFIITGCILVACSRCRLAACRRSVSWFEALELQSVSVSVERICLILQREVH